MLPQKSHFESGITKQEKEGLAKKYSCCWLFRYIAKEQLCRQNSLLLSASAKFALFLSL
jgi:hypothetical protein